jgi:UDP-glucuronate 4-epimerase
VKVLVTGAAGFIGFHVSAAILDRGDQVIGLDNLDDYYDPVLKEARLAMLTPRLGFQMVRGDLADVRDVASAFRNDPDRVVHLAAQPGVRYSITNPRAYVDANVVGTLNILEQCRST